MRIAQIKSPKYITLVGSTFIASDITLGTNRNVDFFPTLKINQSLILLKHSLEKPPLFKAICTHGDILTPCGFHEILKPTTKTMQTAILSKRTMAQNIFYKCETQSRIIQ